MKEPNETELLMLERCKKIGSDGSICMSMDSHLMSCLSDMLINKVWPSLEFLNMIKAGEIEMNSEIVDIVAHNLDEIVTWINFLKFKSGREEQKKVYFFDSRAEAEGYARELSQALVAEKGINRSLIQRLAAIAEFRDSASGNHILRIGLYANKISEMLDLPMRFIDEITVASTLHDIGKMGVSAAILLKPGPLSPAEYTVAKTHTTIGYKILSGSYSPIMKMAAEIALTHHEHWDGSGYPKSLRGREIPLSGSIVKVCDTYDTLRSKRPYKDPVTHGEAVSAIFNGDEKSAPGHFHPDVLDAFIEISPLIDEIFESHRKRDEIITIDI